MAREKGRRLERAQRWRQRLVAIALLLLPGLISAGLLAPGIVQIIRQDDRAAAMRYGPIHPVELAKAPLVVPRDFSTGFVPELLDLDKLFLTSRFRPEPSTRYLARLLSFPHTQGDAIVLDDVGGFTEEIVFRDALEAPAYEIADELPPFPAFLPLHDPFPRGNGVRDDDLRGIDFALPPPVVPEPGTGLLLGFGLVLLALRRRAHGRARGAAPSPAS